MQEKQNQKHLTDAVSGITKVMGNIQNHLENMDRYIRGLKREIDVVHMEMYIESMAGIIESKTLEILRYLDEVTEGIYDGLTKHLSPKIVEPGTMRIALTKCVGYPTVCHKTPNYRFAKGNEFWNQSYLSGILHRGNPVGLVKKWQLKFQSLVEKSRGQNQASS